MIVALTGCVEHLDSHTLVLNVRGVSLELGITSHCYSYLESLNTDEVKILTRYIVREDNQSLFGFYCSEERVLFDKLCLISGVGSKLALAILSAYTHAQLYQLIRLDDVSGLMSISGVGKKMASRLMIELKAIYESNPELIADDSTELPAVSNIIDDVVEALMNMGFEHDEILHALKEADDETLLDVQSLLTYALRRLGGGYHVGSRS